MQTVNVKIEGIAPLLMNSARRVDKTDPLNVQLAELLKTKEKDRTVVVQRQIDLLSFLLANPGRVHSREQLIRRVWGPKFFGERKTVDVHVRWLREKFEPFAQIPFRITTVFGVGYRLDRIGASEPSP